MNETLIGRPRKPVQAPARESARSSYFLRGLDALLVGRSLESVSASSGINKSHISRLRRCISGASWQTVQMLASALGVTTNAIIEAPPSPENIIA